MTFCGRATRQRISFWCTHLIVVAIMTGPLLSSQVRAGEEGPSFRKGLWHFVRTLDIVKNANKNIKYRLQEREMTRCVDPTLAMKATFSEAPIGTCVSDKPEKVGNKYIFAHRCDYMGAVSTVITVNSDESYTEVNEIKVGEHPRTDQVIAHRIGDCQDKKAQGAASSSAIEQ